MLKNYQWQRRFTSTYLIYLSLHNDGSIISKSGEGFGRRNESERHLVPEPVEDQRWKKWFLDNVTWWAGLCMEGAIRAAGDREQWRLSCQTTKFGERAFSYAGQSAWNRLPEDICTESDIANFRKLFKTHYFSWCIFTSALCNAPLTC